MDLSDIDYDLPEMAIAQHPIEPRDAARLLVDQGSRPPLDKYVSDLSSLLQPGDYLVVNNTKVMPARLNLFRQSGGAVEVLMLEPIDEDELRWEALVRPGGRLKVGEPLCDAEGLVLARFGGRHNDGTSDSFVVCFADQVAEAGSGVTARAVMRDHGVMPLPPYIHEQLDDQRRYQTVFADVERSAAAPTAGLHLTPALLDQVRSMGIEVGEVELVVGLGTFKPITTQDPLQHEINGEYYNVPQDVMAKCQLAKRVVAVGTTAVRALESAASSGRLSGRTTLFIHRGYQWKVVDVLMTNFHMPHTSLLLMIDSFVGQRWRKLYQEALWRGYRFLSFGDAMLLDRHLEE